MHAPSAHSAPRLSWLKWLGLACCAVPLSFVLMLATGEGLDGLGHLAQVAPLIAVMVLGAWRPVPGGALIIAGTALVAGRYLVNVAEPQLTLMALLFGPTLVGGIAVLASGLLEGRQPVRRG